MKKILFAMMMSCSCTFLLPMRRQHTVSSITPQFSALAALCNTPGSCPRFEEHVRCVQTAGQGSDETITSCSGRYPAQYPDNHWEARLASDIKNDVEEAIQHKPADRNGKREVEVVRMRSEQPEKVTEDKARQEAQANTLLVTATLYHIRRERLRNLQESQSDGNH